MITIPNTLGKGNDIANVAKGHMFNSRAGHASATTRHRGDVSTDFEAVRGPKTKPRRGAPPLVTRFGVILSV